MRQQGPSVPQDLSVETRGRRGVPDVHPGDRGDTDPVDGTRRALSVGVDRVLDSIAAPLPGDHGHPRRCPPNWPTFPAPGCAVWPQHGICNRPSGGGQGRCAALRVRRPGLGRADASPPPSATQSMSVRHIPRLPALLVSTSSAFFSTLHQRFARARLPDPHPTSTWRLFLIAHHDGLQPMRQEAVWSLPPQSGS